MPPLPATTALPPSDEATITTSNTTNSESKHGNPCTSEGGLPSSPMPGNITALSSEGEPSPPEHPVKSIVTPNIMALPTHPSLYTTPSNATSSTTLRRSKRLHDSSCPHNTKEIEDFNELLNTFRFVTKVPSYGKSSRSSQSSLPPPNPPDLYIPFPKHYVPKVSTSHPMLLRRKRILPSPYSTSHTNYKAQAAQYLALKVFHIYDDSGKRLHIDKLLQQDPKIWPTSLF